MILRDVAAAAGRQYDLVTIGGGIYGAMVAMEAARRGLRPLLLERDDFGGATSWNSHRILHGGLRYLQSLNLRRFRESVSERRWFCRSYPELVEPLECLMPLYGTGLKRTSTFRVALSLNDLLSRARNDGVPEDVHLPAGRVLDASDTASVFPLVDKAGLKGGGVWYDAVMTSSARVLIETLRWACANGATTLNYVECVGLLIEGSRVTGVQAVERLNGDVLEFRAPIVLNCAGPWSRALASSFDTEHEGLFRPSLAFNLLFDRASLSSAALAVTPRYAGARTYFLRPWRDRILAGTFHTSCEEYPASAVPSDEHIHRFLADVNQAIPTLELTPDDVVRVYAGLLPARRQGTEQLAVREVILHHAAVGGPSGLWSLSGVKYTTARRAAERALRRVFGARRDLEIRPGSERPEPSSSLSRANASVLRDGALTETGRALDRLVEEEAVLCMDDLLLRRTDWGSDPESGDDVATWVTDLLGRELPLRAVPDPSGVADR